MKIGSRLLLIVLLYESLSALPGDLLWKYKLEKSSYSSPCASNGLVYITSDFYLYAIDALQGKLRWKYRTGASSNSSPSTSEGVVYIGSADYCLHAVNGSDGSSKWKRITGGSVGQPCVSNGVAYVRSDYLYAINCSDGSTKWKNNLNGYNLSVSDGVLYFGGTEVYEGKYVDYFYAINCSDGSLKWKKLTENEIYRKASISDGIVYFSSRGKIYALDASNGDEIWFFVHGVNSDACVSDSTFYFGDGYEDYSRGTYYIIGCIGAVKQGHLLWEIYESDFVNTPIFSEGVVYAGCDNDCFYAKNTDGTPNWSFAADGPIETAPCILNGIVYFLSYDRYLYAVETYGYKGFSNSNGASSIPDKVFCASPNPFFLHLTLSLPYSASIYSLTGQLIIKLKAGKHELDTSKWREGVYIIECNNINKKIVKIK